MRWLVICGAEFGDLVGAKSRSRKMQKCLGFAGWGFRNVLQASDFREPVTAKVRSFAVKSAFS